MSVLKVIAGLDFIALGTALTALIAALSTFKKAKAEHKDALIKEQEFQRGAWVNLIKDQKDLLDSISNSLLSPMEKRIEVLEKKVKDNEDEIKKITEEKKELEEFKNLFFIALKYIKNLCSWLVSQPIDKKNKPVLPCELKEFFK